jgi:hypothetical protein
MKINSKDFIAPPGEEVILKEWPTRLEPLCQSKKKYPKPNANRRRELRAIRKVLQRKSNDNSANSP